MDPDFESGRRAGIRQAITWLHNRAQQMNDPNAKTVLNSAAFSLGRSGEGKQTEPECRATLDADGRCATCGWNAKTKSYETVE